MTVKFKASDGRVFRLYIEGVKCAFSQLSISYGSHGMPQLQAVVPDTPHIRYIEPRSKVHLIFRDDTYEVPRFCVFFEGEVLSKGFQKDYRGRRSFSFSASHIGNILTSIPLHLLDPDESLRNKMIGQDVLKSFNGGLTGTTYEFLSPRTLQKDEEIMEELGVTDRVFNLYDYVKAAYMKFNQVFQKTAINQVYEIRHLDIYGLKERFYQKKKAGIMRWADMFNEFLTLYFMNVLPKSQSQLTFYDTIKQMVGPFAYDLVIQGSPKRLDQTFLVKPKNPFMPVPSCNVIYPIFNSLFSYDDNWDQKITRLEQHLYPTLAQGEKALFAKSWRALSPPELQFNHDEYEKALKDTGNTQEALEELSKLYEDEGNEDARKFSLITREEYDRGIVEAYNEFPPFMAMALRILFKKPNKYKNDKESKKKKRTATRYSTADYNGAYTTEQIPADFNRELYEDALLIAEADAELRNICNIAQTSQTPNIDTANVYIPTRIFLIKTKLSRGSVPLDGNNFSAQDFHKNITGSSALRGYSPHFYIFKDLNEKIHFRQSLARNYNIFKKPPTNFPVMLHLTGIPKKNGNNSGERYKVVSPSLIYVFEDNKETKATEYCSTVDYYTPINTEETAAALSFGNEEAVFIYVDSNVDIDETKDFLSYLSVVIGAAPDPDSILIMSPIQHGWETTAFNGSLGYKDEKISSLEKAVKSQIDSIVKELSKKASKKLDEILNKDGLTLASVFNQIEVNINSISSTDRLTSVNRSNPDPLASYPDNDPEYDSEESVIGELDLNDEDIATYYLKPMADYFFYLNRFSSSNKMITSAFNPYITPGYTAIVMDHENKEEGKFLLGYVGNVTHTITSTSISTGISLEMVRRADDYFNFGISVPDEENTFTPDAIVGDVFQNGDINVPEKKEMLHKKIEKIPFFGGGYSTTEYKGNIPLELTFKDLLGKGVKITRKQDLIDNAGISNIENAYLRVQREFQTCYPIGPNLTEDVKKEYYGDPKWEPGALPKGDGWLVTTPSLYEFDWVQSSTSKFPDSIMLKGSRKKEGETVKFFNGDVAKKIREHTLACNNIEGIIGGNESISDS